MFTTAPSTVGPGVDVIDPHGSMVYINWTDTEEEIQEDIEKANRAIAVTPVLGVQVAGEMMCAPFTVLPQLTNEENRELVQAACVVCMTRLNNRYQVRGDLTDRQYRRAANMLLAGMSPCHHNLPTSANEIIPLLAGVDGEGGVEDDLFIDFMELYLEVPPVSFGDRSICLR